MLWVFRLASLRIPYRRRGLTVFHPDELLIIHANAKPQSDEDGDNRDTQTLRHEIDGIEYIMGVLDSHGEDIKHACW